MEEQAKTEAGDARLRIPFVHRGRARAICLERAVNSLDEDAAELAHPYATTPQPMKDGKPDTGPEGEAWMRERVKIEQSRGLYLVAVALGAAECGGKETIPERVAWLRSEYQRWQLRQLISAVRDPLDITEEEVRAAMAELYPTKPFLTTPEQASPA